jgi:hypothetical protein
MISIPKCHFDFGCSREYAKGRGINEEHDVDEPHAEFLFQ